MIYDIIFDFSASPVGGGLLRLCKYIDYFNKTNANVLFIAHPKTRELLSKYNNVKVEYLSRPVLRRIFNDRSIISKYQDRANCFFSYGIPIYQRMSKLDWFHLSNTLPFAYNDCTVSRLAKIKNYLLFRMFKSGVDNPNIVSAESGFSLDLYSSRCGTQKETIILRNGTDSILFNTNGNPKKEPVVLTVGVEGYKRISKVFDEYLQMKKSLDIKELIIVGSPERVPKNIIETPGVRVTGFLSTQELSQLYTTSMYYISASEIENSSVAVIEALAGGAICILSRIPSHLEMFNLEIKQQYAYKAGTDFFISDITRLRPEQRQTWKEIILLMLDRMNKK